MNGEVRNFSSNFPLFWGVPFFGILPSFSLLRLLPSLYRQEGAQYWLALVTTDTPTSALLPHHEARATRLPQAPQ